jgi:signal transduction histidine kinase
MSEAAQLEDSLRNNAVQRFDLVPVLTEIGGAYAGAFPTHRVQLAITPASAPVRGTPELLVQALDKLMDNAAAFSPPGGTIEIALSEGSREWLLAVDNEGPPLPTALQERLFEPMVSHRDEGGQGIHMGLGLHVVQLICRAFGGSAIAANRPEGDGVTITLHLPMAG